MASRRFVMELIPSFIVFVVALLWKTDQDTKRKLGR